MGFLGSTLGLTPALDAFAKRSIVFTRAYAHAPITTVSHATILTGTYPPFHQVTDFGAPLPAFVPYLPHLFKQRGYRTGAFVGSLILDPRHGMAPGFERGFDDYDAGFRLRRPGEDRYQTLERRGQEVVVRARRWWRQESTAPRFAWVHLYDAHDPYDPPPDLKPRFPDPYNGEVAAMDRAVAQLLDAAGTDTIVVVAADHGESLGDHGERTHGVFLYDAALHVPLLVHLTGDRSAGARVAARVRLADSAPTILEAAGIRAPVEMQGASLLPLIAPRAGDQPSADRPVYAETDYPRSAFGWSRLASWRDEQFLFVRAPRPELYDLVADPAAARNLIESRRSVAAGMDAELSKFVQASGRAGGAAAPPKPQTDPELTRRLAALGYVGGTSAPAGSSGLDPKDRIGTANALHEAIVAVDDGAFARATPLLEKVVAAEPNIPIAQLNLGVARSRQRQYARAVEPLKRAIELQPDVMVAHYELAIALYETGDLKTAAAHFEIVALKMPKWADARYSLASVYARIDRVGDAVEELKAALTLEPRHFRANLLLGRILTLQGHAAAAIPHLRIAVEVQPTSAEAYTFLADAYERAGNRAEAEKARQRARERKK